MPTYDYACAGCGGFDAIRVLAQRDEPALCPDCGAASPRDYARLKQPAGCGCCSTAKRGATLTGANGNKAFPSKRPWMISH